MSSEHPHLPEPTPSPTAAPHLSEAGGGKYSRLHPSSLIFDLIAHGRAYLVPAALGLWGAAKGDLTMLIISALIFVPAFLTSVFRYFTYQYRIEKDHLIVRHGLVFKNVRTVPVSRIQNIDFVQNVLHRMMKVAEVKIETASGTRPEATMRVLSMRQMENMRTAVFDKQAAEKKRTLGLKSADGTVETAVPGFPLNHASPASSQAVFENEAGQNLIIPNHGHDSPLEIDTIPSSADQGIFGEPAVTLLEIPTGWLIKIGLASNRGMTLVAVLIGAYFQFGRPSKYMNDVVQSLTEDVAYGPMMILISVAGLIGAMLLLRLLGIAWFVLSFHGYRLVRHGDDMRISCGLLTRVSATVPRQRIQFISIHRNIIMRMMGLSSIRIETAGGAGTENENASETVSKRWFVPVVPSDQVPRLLAELRPGLEWDESQLDFQPLAAKAARRLCRFAILETIVFLGIGLAISLRWGWILGLIALPLTWMWAIKKSKAMRYARTEKGVVFRSGVLTRKTSITFFEKIQTLRVDQSPFDRRWKMGKLCVDTAAAGPASHQINVPYLDEQFAFDELQRLRLKTGQQQPVFG